MNDFWKNLLSTGADLGLAYLTGGGSEGLNLGSLGSTLTETPEMFGGAIGGFTSGALDPAAATFGNAIGGGTLASSMDTAISNSGMGPSGGELSALGKPGMGKMAKYLGLAQMGADVGSAFAPKSAPVLGGRPIAQNQMPQLNFKQLMDAAGGPIY